MLRIQLGYYNSLITIFLYEFIEFEKYLTTKQSFLEIANLCNKENSEESTASYDRLDFTQSSSIKDEMTFEKLLLQSDGDLVLSRDMLR